MNDDASFKNGTAEPQPLRAGPQGAAIVRSIYDDPVCAALLAELLHQRQRLGISEYQMALFAEISRSTVSRLFRGRIMPTLNVTQRCGRVCGLGLGWRPLEPGKF